MVNWEGGGFFKYYELEQYEKILRKTLFDKDSNYIFTTDPKIIK